MRGLIRSIILGALAVCVVGVLTVGSASAEILKVNGAASGLFAFVGSPSAKIGAASDFGIGENAVFRGGELPAIGANVSITLSGNTDTCKDTIAGGTLVSNTTGVNNPVGFDIQSVDFQDCTVATVSSPTYTDTKDNVWRARLKKGANETTIEGIVVDVGGTLLRGAVKGTWKEGAVGVAPCITLTEVGTLATDPGGVNPTAIAGEVCLISANNDWYSGHEPKIELENK